jgi:HIV Tat-specific factor 1
LATWDSDDEEEVKKTYAPKKNKWAKYVVIINAFRPIDFDDDVDLYNHHKDEMTYVAEVVEIEVTKVEIYDLEPRGIIVVRTKDFDSAEKFRDYINNNNKPYKIYDHQEDRKLVAYIPDERPKFRKSKEAPVSDDEDDKPLPQVKVKKDDNDD